jgi:UDP-glucose-4-epimerase GalE
MDAILVTGGAGYIGSHACKTLAKAGFLPIAYDNLSSGHAYAVKWGPLIEGDLCDRKKLTETIQKFRPKAVLHFAASILVPESIVDPGKYYYNNLVSSITLLEVMRDHNILNLIFSSTCSTYGDVLSVPIKENCPQAPNNPYGRSKYMIEQMIADFEKAHGFRSVILRYFNVAGADLDGEIGEDHFPETHLIPSVILTALGLKQELTVYGIDFPTDDGSAVRDYVHVQDLVDAHIAALYYLINEKKSARINLGTGKGHSVLEIIEAVEKHSKKPLPVKIVGQRKGESPILTADNRLAKKILGWTPHRSDISSLISSAWKWHQTLLAMTKADLLC